MTTIRTSVALLALACAVDEGDVPSLPESPPEPFALTTPAPTPTPPAFRLEAGNLVAGTLNGFTITGAPPSSTVLFAYSPAGLGDGLCIRALGDRCVALRAPVSPLPVSLTTNVFGEGTLTVNLPRSLGGTYVGMQATVLGANGGLSTAIGRIIHPAGTIIQPLADHDGDGTTAADGDCDDLNPGVGPGRPDSLGDGFDVDCDGSDGTDADLDGAASLASGGGDCDDADPTRRPGLVDTCNGVDDDCDGVIDGAGGQPSCGRTEDFGVNTGGAVDVLLVIDDSCSMSDEQVRLAAELPTFATAIASTGADFHLGVITTDMVNPTKSGRLQSAAGYRYVDAATPNLGAVFSQMALVGTNGDVDESGREAIFAALTPPLLNGPNAGFYRSDADLHLVVLSDEDDSSPSPTRADFIRDLQNLKAPPLGVWFHTLVGPLGGCPTAFPGAEYLAVGDAIGGLELSICAPTYASFVDDLTDLILANNTPALPIFTLADVPDPATIVVQVTLPGIGTITLSPSQWVYDAGANTIEIVGLSLPVGTTVRVTYDL